MSKVADHGRGAIAEWVLGGGEWGVEWLKRGRGREREWVHRLMFAGLEAEALGHKGHALYRQRRLHKPKEEAIRLLICSIRLSSGVLSAVCRALSPVGSSGREGHGGTGDEGENARQRERGKGEGQEGGKDGGQLGEGGSWSWRERAKVVKRDVSATRVIALGTLGDVYLALGAVFEARAAYKACQMLVPKEQKENECDAETEKIIRPPRQPNVNAPQTPPSEAGVFAQSGISSEEGEGGTEGGRRRAERAGAGVSEKSREIYIIDEQARVEKALLRELHLSEDLFDCRARIRSDADRAGMGGGRIGDVRTENVVGGGVDLEVEVNADVWASDVGDAVNKEGKGVDETDNATDTDEMEGKCQAALTACFGDAHVRFEEFDAAVDAGLRARALAATLQHARIMCKGSYLAGYGLMMQGRLEEADEWMRICHAECVQGNFHNSRAYLLLAQGDLALWQCKTAEMSRVPSLLASALRLLQNGLALAKRVEDAPCECLALLRLAVYYFSRHHRMSTGNEKGLQEGVGRERVEDDGRCAAHGGELGRGGMREGGVGEESGKEEGGERAGRETLSEVRTQEACPGGRGGGVREEWEKGRELLRSSLLIARELQDLIGESNILEVMGRHELCRGQVCVGWGLGALVESN
jgi:hypothetical protein